MYKWIFNFYTFNLYKLPLSLLMATILMKNMKTYVQIF